MIEASANKRKGTWVLFVVHGRVGIEKEIGAGDSDVWFLLDFKRRAREAHNYGNLLLSYMDELYNLDWKYNGSEVVSNKSKFYFEV